MLPGGETGQKSRYTTSVPHSPIIRPNPSTIPDELKQRRQWVVWRLELNADGKLTKVPYQPNHPQSKARVNDVSTWGSFAEARAAYESGDFSGVMYVFTNEDPYTGIDLDHAVDAKGTVSPQAAFYVEQLDSYTEVSPSGSGLHVIVKGKLPPGGRKKGLS